MCFQYFNFSMSTKWSVRTRNDKSGTYALYHGRAYPKLAKEAPADNIVRTDYSSTASIYNDPVFQLNDQDMDDLDGADGAPICYEHDKGDVVGFVKHSYVGGIGDGDRALDIIARIPVKDASGHPIRRGETIVQEIMAGKIKGFSVNYTAKVDHDTNKLRSKAFHEISLVREPFFGGCDLNVGIMASADGGSELHGKIWETIERSYISFALTTLYLIEQSTSLFHLIAP